ncbi:glucokinase [Sulfuriferula plumbiphila]|uniref:Glucokinase n=1 Tax=Sulfuriferula plumbiphila TaxID=171865 RepID=A0A512LAH7_9PROT|nr:glucokinase [Sulfuriferula plumbiphila]BBP04954.1 glucokinase [Sulfuriferula plumbiphila]GEP31479.1 glucokinase [Sulfuriferula plumbiphila]
MSKPKHILAGDVGGTKVLLRLSRIDAIGCVLVREQRFSSADFPDFEALLAQFLLDAPAIAAACFGVPGPVKDNAARLTNLPWFVDGSAIGRRFGIISVRILNDFAAVGHGIAALPPEDLRVLQAGAAQDGAARAVLGAGTGLGVGFVFPCGEGEIVVPTEGGNVDFAPGTEMEIELLRFLRRRYGQVCVERVVSGPGLANIYAFVCEYGQHPPVLLESADPPAAIAEAAQSNTDVAASHALAMFIRAYGAFAGDLALLSLSRGGVYVAGGVAAKLATQMAQGGFVAGFLDKGRYRSLLETVPLYLVMNTEVGLLGAERLAARQVSA